MAKLEDLLKALLKNGLKISPKKCKLLRTNLHYMGNEIFIQNNREAIQKLQPPTTTKECRTFVGMVNFLSIFLPTATEIVKAHL